MKDKGRGVFWCLHCERWHGQDVHKPKEEKCERCKGTGMEWFKLGEEAEKDVCGDCDGKGKL